MFVCPKLTENPSVTCEDSLSTREKTSTSKLKMAKLLTHISRSGTYITTRLRHMPQDAGRCEEWCRSPSARRCDSRSPFETRELLPPKYRKLTCSDRQAKDPHADSAFNAILTAGTGMEGVVVRASLIYFVLSPRATCAIAEWIEMAEDAAGSTHNG